MTFAEVLMAKDEAVNALNLAREALLAATEAHRKAQSDHDAATAAVADSHKAIRDKLADKGNRSIQSPDGTITIYRLSEHAELGWLSEHPVPGESD